MSPMPNNNAFWPLKAAFDSQESFGEPKLRTTAFPDLAVDSNRPAFYENSKLIDSRPKFESTHEHKGYSPILELGLRLDK